MIRLAAVFFLFLLVANSKASIANERQFLSVLDCDSDAGVVLNLLDEKYKEIPFAEATGIVRNGQTGRFYTSYVILYVNPETKTWTLVSIFDDDGTGCIVQSGKDFRPATLPQGEGS